MSPVNFCHHVLTDISGSARSRTAFLRPTRRSMSSTRHRANSSGRRRPNTTSLASSATRRVSERSILAFSDAPQHHTSECLHDFSPHVTTGYYLFNHRHELSDRGNEGTGSQRSRPQGFEVMSMVKTHLLLIAVVTRTGCTVLPPITNC